MNQLSRYLYKYSTIPLALVFTVAMILYASAILGSQSKCITELLLPGQSVLGLKFGYDLNFVVSIFERLDESSLKCYLRFLYIWDNIFPLIYGSMYLLWLSVIYRKIFTKQNWPINIFPLLPVILDWIENFFEAGLVKSYLVSPSLVESSVSTASFISQMKWSASMVNYFLIGGGILFLVFRRFFRKTVK